MSDGSSAVRPGNRVVVALVGALIGLVYGAIATVGHRQSLRLGDVTIPWGIVAALAGVAALLIGLRVLAGRLAAGAAALGVIAIVALLSLPGVGGSVLIPATLVGTIWAVGPALVSVMIVAWPSMSAVRRGGARPNAPAATEPTPAA